MLFKPPPVRPALQAVVKLSATQRTATPAMAPEIPASLKTAPKPARKVGRSTARRVALTAVCLHTAALTVALRVAPTLAPMLVPTVVPTASPTVVPMELAQPLAARKIVAMAVSVKGKKVVDSRASSLPLMQPKVRASKQLRRRAPQQMALHSRQAWVSVGATLVWLAMIQSRR